MASPSETTLIVLGAAAPARADRAGDRRLLADGDRDRPDDHAAARRDRPRRRAADRARGDGADARSAARRARARARSMIGFGRVGRMVADMLAAHGQPYRRGRGRHRRRQRRRARDGYPVMFGDVARAELVDRLNLGHAKALILTMDDPVLTVRLTKRVRGWCPTCTIVARARDAAPCRRALPRRRHRRGAGDARKLAATVRSGAGRSRRGDGPGDRLDPREARRAARRRSSGAD